MTSRFINPELIWENEDRYSNGCFACAVSRREVLRGKLQRYCQAEEDGLIKPDYPNEDETTCQLFWRKKGGI